MKNNRTLYFATHVCVAALLHWAGTGELRADSSYKAKAGKISFSVESNITFLKVAGSSSAIKGGGAATVEGKNVTVRDLHFEVDPKTFKTGISLRDQHLYEK